MAVLYTIWYGRVHSVHLYKTRGCIQWCGRVHSVHLYTQHIAVLYTIWYGRVHSVHLYKTRGLYTMVWTSSFYTPVHNTWLNTKVWRRSFYTPVHNTWLYTMDMDEFMLYTCPQHVAVYNGYGRVHSIHL